jgi:hypothetical protein
VFRSVRILVLAGVSTLTAVPVLAQYPYPPYGWGYRYDITGSARIQVDPEKAEVYVDGYFVGIADDFDGAFQRLHVEAGEHELQIHLEGYRTIRQKVLFRPRTTLKVTYVMEPLAAGEVQEPRPKPDESARGATERRPMPGYGRRQSAQFGTLVLRVQPADAVILIDGEEWKLAEGEDQFSVDLPEGPHRVEIRKDGFRTYVRMFDVRRGRTVTLNVSLTAGRDGIYGLSRGLE